MHGGFITFCKARYQERHIFQFLGNEKIVRANIWNFLCGLFCPCWNSGMQIMYVYGQPHLVPFLAHLFIVHGALICILSVCLSELVEKSDWTIIHISENIIISSQKLHPYRDSRCMGAQCAKILTSLYKKVFTVPEKFRVENNSHLGKFRYRVHNKDGKFGA